MRRTRAIIDAGLLLFLAGAALGIVGGSYRPFAGLKKGPETKKLEAAQVALADAQQQAKQAEAAKEAAIRAEREKMQQQVRSAQGDAAATSAALDKVPGSGPELKIAKAFAGRVNMKLAVAIGSLPPQEQQAMIELVDGLIADSAEAHAKLEALDARFKAISEERTALQAQVPILEQKARKAQETAQDAEAMVEVKVRQVKEWAEKARQREVEAGSLGASLNKLLWIAGSLAALFFFLRDILPLVGAFHLKFWDLDDADSRVSAPIRDLGSLLAISGSGFAGTLCSEWGGHEWLDDADAADVTRRHLALARAALADGVAAA